MLHKMKSAAKLLLALAIFIITVEALNSCDPRYEELFSQHTMCLGDVGTDIPLSDADKQAITDKHNEYRSNVSPTAKNLFKVVWDDNIAVVAAKWARQCRSAHDENEARLVPSLPGVHIGQSVVGGRASVLKAVESWHSEEQFFKYGKGNISNDEVRHYTQIVGFRVMRIGCGAASCPSAGKYSNYQVCNYAMGQYVGDLKKPYAKGASCKLCPAGNCSDNLCYCDGKICLNGGTFDPKTCTCSCYAVFSGDVCQNKNCPRKENGYCSSLSNDTANRLCRAHNFQAYCPMLCGLCSGPANCPDKRCQNGGQLNPDTCICQCSPHYTGDLCETLVCPPRNAPQTHLCEQYGHYCKEYWNVPYICPREFGKCN